MNLPEGYRELFHDEVIVDGDEFFEVKSNRVYSRICESVGKTSQQYYNLHPCDKGLYLIVTQRPAPNKQAIVIAAPNQVIWDSLLSFAAKNGFRVGVINDKFWKEYGKESAICFNEDKRLSYSPVRFYINDYHYKVSNINDLDMLFPKEEPIKAGDYIVFVGPENSNEYWQIGSIHEVVRVECNYYVTKVKDFSRGGASCYAKDARKATAEEITKYKKEMEDQFGIGDEIPKINTDRITLKEGSLSRYDVAKIWDFMRFKPGGFNIFWDGKELTVGCKKIPLETVKKILKKMEIE